MATYPGLPGWQMPKTNLSVARKVSRTEAMSATKRRKRRAMQKIKQRSKQKKKEKRSLDLPPH